MSAEAVILGTRLEELAANQAEWSQSTFGNDETRGPIGALRHLAKEAKEAEEACDRLSELIRPHTSPAHGSLVKAVNDVAEEMADCFLLLLDASRRAGLKPLDLVNSAMAKMCVNRNRRYPSPVDGQPCEHVRGVAA